jgi:hypothetical protein
MSVALKALRSDLAQAETRKAQIDRQILVIKAKIADVTSNERERQTCIVCHEQPGDTCVFAHCPAMKDAAHE